MIERLLRLAAVYVDLGVAEWAWWVTLTRVFVPWLLTQKTQRT